MKNRLSGLSRKILCILLLAAMTTSMLSVPVSAKSQYTADRLEKIIDGILSSKQKQFKVSGVQAFIDTGLAKTAGTSPTEWYVIALCQYKTPYDYSRYLSALDRYADKMKNASAVDMQRIALAYSAVGDNEKFITKTLNSSIGKLGIMSYIYGLILLDSGSYDSKAITRDKLVNKILSMRLSDGGWALSGKVSDVDVTAMALQALAPYSGKSKAAKAINGALKLLSKKQLKTGDYKSWGVRSCETTAQVINALCALGINCQKDKRFIKNNRTLIDGLLPYAKSDGSFSHTVGGASNDTANVQVMSSLVAVWRQMKGYDSFYHFADSKTTSALGKSSSTGGGNSLNSGDNSNVTDKNTKITGKTVNNSDKVSAAASSNTGNVQAEKGLFANHKGAVIILVLAGMLLLLGSFLKGRRRARKI